jgi:hypothetical protein
MKLNFGLGGDCICDWNDARGWVQLCIVIRWVLAAADREVIVASLARQRLNF